MQIPLKQDFLFSSPEIESMKPKKRFSIKLTEMKFDSCLLTLVGSNSPANLASRAVRVLILDEADKFKTKTAKEADALSLAKQRTRSFPESKIYISSTPTIWEGTIWQEFLNGDQRRYFVPCPHCGKEIVLSLNPKKSVLKTLGCEAMLHWDSSAKRADGNWDYDIVGKSAHFVCPHCGKRIEERYKTQMNSKGIWRPTNSDYCDLKVRSYHLPTFYAPWKKAGWGALAVEFLKAKKSVDGLKDFLNSVCAEPDMGQYDGRTLARLELVLENVDTAKDATRIMTVDVQKDHFWYLIRDWQQGGDSVCVKWGKAFSFEELSEIEKANSVKYVGLDSGFNTTDVYRECARYSWFAMRGDDRESFTNKNHVQVPYNVRLFDPMIGTKNQGLKKIAELRWSNPTIKDILARLRNASSAPVKWAIPIELATEEYFRHLDGEYKKRITDPKSGKSYYKWVLRNSRWENHLFDCECMSISVAMFLGLLKGK